MDFYKTFNRSFFCTQVNVGNPAQCELEWLLFGHSLLSGVKRRAPNEWPHNQRHDAD